MPSWKMMKEFGKAIGKRIGQPNKTSKMIERVADNSDEFLEGKRRGQFLKGKATDAAYQSMYDKLDDNARAVFDAYSFDIERAYGPDDAYSIAIKESGVDPDNVPGDLTSWKEQFGFDISEPAPRNVDISNRVDKLATEESDKALNTDFDKAFDEAIVRRKEERLNEWDWDGEPKSDANTWDYEATKDREAEAEQQVRDELIQKLKSGMPLSDFFEKYGQRPMD